MAPKKKDPVKPKRLIRTKTFFFRVVATFFASAFSVIGLGSVFGIDLLKSAAFAGVLGLINVAEALARAYLTDGKLTMTEINYAFKNYDEDSGEESGSSCHCTKCCPNA